MAHDMNELEIEPITTEVEAEPPPVVPQQFEVKDPSSANWVVRRVVAARQYAAHIKAWSAAELKRAEREEQFFLLHFGPQLEAWLKPQLHQLRRKSLALPAGTIGFRNTPPKLLIIDETQLIGWCRRHLPEAIQVKTTLLTSLLKQHLERTGECPQGIELADAESRFYIK
jgi:hypothetical protein